MKKTILFLGIILIGIVVAVWNACQTDSQESCTQAEICTDKLVTSCCTDNDCVYKYNGKEYTEDEREQLAEDLGCITAVSGLKSTDQDNDLSGVIERLKALMEEAHKLANTKK